MWSWQSSHLHVKTATLDFLSFRMRWKKEKLHISIVLTWTPFNFLVLFPLTIFFLKTLFTTTWFTFSLSVDVSLVDSDHGFIDILLFKWAGPSGSIFLIYFCQFCAFFLDIQCSSSFEESGRGLCVSYMYVLLWSIE